MRTRLLHLVETEGLTKQQFAHKLSISPAAVTHILSGRNSPSLEIIAKIAATFPQYNLRWLILGEPPMLINNTAEADMTIESAPDTILQPALSVANDAANEFHQPSTSESELSTNKPATRLIVCFPDNTFKEYSSQQ